MLVKLSEKIRDCHERAAEARRKAEAIDDPALRADFLDMEERWLTLARSYGFTETLGDFTAAMPATRLQPDERLGADGETLQLREISTLLIRENNVSALYDRLLDAAIGLMSADMGSMQTLDHERGDLRLLAYKGFHSQSAAFWQRVRVDAASTCGAALSSGTRVIVPDVEACSFMQGTADLDSYRVSGIRAVHSTPLLSRSGLLLGMISTHWREPHQPSERALRLLDVLVRQAADLIERSKAEAALRESEEQFRQLASIVESSDDAIISLSPDGNVMTWNRGAERLYGYAREEIVGQPIHLIIPPNRREEEAINLARIKRGERIDPYDTIRVHRNGSLVPVSLTVSPLNDSAGRIIGASKIARDITERKRAEEQVQLLSREIDHRARNLLAVVQATVHMSQGITPRELKEAIEGRIQALSNAHTLLAESRWTGVDLGNVVRQELLPYCSEEFLRTNVSGPDLLLGPSHAQSLAIVFHELTTNAVKYGSLSVSAGFVRINWSQEPDGRLQLRWTEVGGPPIEQPRHHGFGIRVLQQVVHEQLWGEMRLDWREDGLACEIAFMI
jgi:PAS domain S-box-containing protein